MPRKLIPDDAARIADLTTLTDEQLKQHIDIAKGILARRKPAAIKPRQSRRVGVPGPESPK